MIINMLGLIDATTLCPDMKVLTKYRQVSAMPIGAKYRIIDFNLSSMKHSGIRNVAIFPNWNYRSLVDHIGSGKIWDLDRNKDGLFILPPKKEKDSMDEIISFAKIAEHIEFLVRSTQDYVLLTQGNIVWNINFEKVLEHHIEQKADITKVLHNGRGTNTFIISRELLITKVMQSEILNYKNINEVVNFENNLKIVKYEYKEFTKQIKDVHTYFEANMLMMNKKNIEKINPINRLILTKDNITTPTYYNKEARVKNSIVANGCNIAGSVNNSSISANAQIGKGSVINNSIIMQEVKIGENAYIENAILDKRTIVANGATIIGSPREIAIKSKNSKILSNTKIKIAHIASEMAPYAKTGGLSEIVKTLPKYIKLQEFEVITIIPYYKSIEKNYARKLSKIKTLKLKNIIDEDITIEMYNTLEDGITKYFIKVGNYFNRDEMYGYNDDALRFFLFSLATQKLIYLLEENVSIIHTHDWHTGLLSRFIRRDIHKKNTLNKIRFIHTIHNIGYQGIFKLNEFVFSEEVKEKYFPHDEFNSDINFMEQAIINADKITTVSPTYCKELQYEYFAMGLEKLIKSRDGDVVGILNGIDVREHNPMHINVYKPFDINTIENKLLNKLHLQETFSLVQNEEIPIVIMVTRFTEAKGIDLILHIFDELMEKEPFQFIVLGEGDLEYEEKLIDLMGKYPNNVKIKIGYEVDIARKMYAGGDMMLMPSRFEPCGLSQMFALRYGTIPIVRETGGLVDSVFPYNEFSKEGNGFSFSNYNAHEMMEVIMLAFKFFKQKYIWNKIMQQAMCSDNSWDKSAKKYTDLYLSIVR